MGKQRKVTKSTQKTAAISDEKKLALVGQGLTKMGQDFSQAAKQFAESNGVSVHIHITLIPTLKETANGRKQ